MQIQSFEYEPIRSKNEEDSEQELLIKVFSDRNYWMTLSNEEKRSIYRALVEKVIVKDGKVLDVNLKI